MLILLPPNFVAKTKMTFGYNFEGPINRITLKSSLQALATRHIKRWICDYKGGWTHNHLLCKRMLNHLVRVYL